MTQLEDKELRTQRSIVKRKLKSLKVTTTLGNEFDADEISQDRIVRAIDSSHATHEWKLANNTSVTVNKAELQEVLDAAILLTEAIILGKI